MASITVTVGSSIGLHARPASIISDAAGEMDAEVTLALPDGEPVEADSALLIMTLGASYGDQVIVSSDDEEAAMAIAKLVALDLDDPSYEP
jgi:phosphocarrier protein